MKCSTSTFQYLSLETVKKQKFPSAAINEVGTYTSKLKNGQMKVCGTILHFVAYFHSKQNLNGEAYISFCFI